MNLKQTIRKLRAALKLEQQRHAGLVGESV
jgi:hypothetical protein